MKQLVVLVGCCVFLLVPAGCQNAGRARKDVDPGTPRGGVDVIVEGGGEFPEFLVGQWKADQYNWAFKFEPDGSISSIVHNIWALEIDLDEGGFYTEGPDENSYAVFIMGPCEADYNPATRELSVKIIMDRYEIKLPVGSLEGRSEDYFDGPVSKDGMKWNVRWREYGYLEDATPPDVNYIDAHPEPLVFTKLNIK